MGPPLVSVVVATHLSRPPYLATALRSVIEQTYPYWELALVLDGCELADPPEPESRVSVVQLPKVGVARARNHGLGTARGEFVTFLDHDDVYLPNHLEVAVERLSRQPDAVACFSSINVVAGTDAEPLFTSWSEPVTRRSVLSGGARPSMTSLVMRRRAVAEVGGFDLGIDGADDVGLIYKLAELGPFAPIEEATVCYRLHEHNWSSDTRAMAASGDSMLAVRLRQALSRKDTEAAGYIRQAQRASRRYYAGEAISKARALLQAGKFRDALGIAGWAVARDPAVVPVRALARLKRRSEEPTVPAPLAGTSLTPPHPR